MRSGYALMLPLPPNMPAFGTQLLELMADPEMAALLDASPRARRLMASLRRMIWMPPPEPDAPPVERPRRKSPVPSSAAQLARAPSRWRVLDPFDYLPDRQRFMLSFNEPPPPKPA